MARSSPAVGVAAALVAGAALWLTRATLDVVPAPDGATRVAMLPSWPELVGLTVLAFLLVLLARTLARRIDRALLPHAAPSRRSVPPDVVVPLFALCVLVLPYLPWLADAVPALRALAGPGAAFVWAIALGHVAWVAWDVWLRGRAHAWRLSGWPGVLVAGVVTGGVAIAAAARLETGPLAVLRDGVAAAPIDLGGSWTGTGDWTVTIALAVVIALVAALQWRAAASLTGSSGAATVGWLAVGLSAPMLLTVFAGSPAALVALLLLAGVVGLGRPADRRPPVLAFRAACLGVVPWLGVAFGPASLVLALFVVGQAGRHLLAIAAASVPYALLAGAALVSGRWTVPPLEASGFADRALGVIFDQEHGALLYVPALVAVVPGLWRLWRSGGESRRLFLAVMAATAAVLVAAAVGEDRWRHPFLPGLALVPVLPLLGLVVAHWERHVETASVRRGLVRLLTLAGLAVTASVLLVRDGGLLVGHRDGIAELLVWLSPGHELARVVPALAPPRGDRLGFWIATATWTAAIAGAGWIARRRGSEAPGRGAVVASGLALAVAIVPAILIPVLAGGRIVPIVDPSERAQSPALFAFDARRRPVAIVYDPFRVVRSHAVPGLYAFDATPGLRRYPQPVRVLLNARLSLPAGTYRVTLTPRPGAAIAGAIGLQVGRIGSPIETWQADGAAGAPWERTFHLHVDAAFVGLRTTPAVEAQVAAVRFAPIAIVDASRRPALPPVLSASRYQGVTTYFHDEHAYTEPAGFWVRGRSTLLATMAWDPVPEARAGVTLALHSGAAPNVVRIDTPAWHTTVDLEPGVTREVHVPARPGQGTLQVRLSPERGFVPAEAGGSDDRRVLGSWVEILR